MNGNISRILCSFRRTPKKIVAEGRDVRKRRDLSGRGMGSTSAKRVLAGADVSQVPDLEIEVEDDGAEGDNEIDDDELELDQDNGFFDGEADVGRTWEAPMDVPLKRTRTKLDLNHSWSYSMRPPQSPHKKARHSYDSVKTVLEGDIEFMILSSD